MIEQKEEHKNKKAHRPPADALFLEVDLFSTAAAQSPKLPQTSASTEYSEKGRKYP